MSKQYRVVMYQPCDVRRSLVVEADSPGEARRKAREVEPGSGEYATILRFTGPVGWESVNAVGEAEPEDN